MTPTTLYEALYVTTWALHAFSAQLVLAGTLCLSILSLRPASRAGALENDVRDWLPFALGVAITLGVAPLLFVQILHPNAFYTANLLLSHRFMAALPALIVGFYLLYVAKTTRGHTHPVLRRVVPLLALACFGFTAWSWTENRLLSQASEDWSSFYASGNLLYSSPELWPRLACFAVMSVPSAALALTVLRPAHLGTTRSVVLIALAMQFGCAAWWLGCAQPVASSLPIAAIAATTGIEAAGWFARRPLVVTVGRLATLAWLGIVREALRPSSEAVSEYVASRGGMVAFVCFALLNAAVVTACMRRVIRELRETS